MQKFLKSFARREKKMENGEEKNFQLNVILYLFYYPL